MIEFRGESAVIFCTFGNIFPSLTSFNVSLRLVGSANFRKEWQGYKTFTSAKYSSHCTSSAKVWTISSSKLGVTVAKQNGPKTISGLQTATRLNFRKFFIMGKFSTKLSWDPVTSPKLSSLKDSWWQLISPWNELLSTESNILKENSSSLIPFRLKVSRMFIWDPSTSLRWRAFKFLKFPESRTAEIISVERSSPQFLLDFSLFKLGHERRRSTKKLGCIFLPSTKSSWMFGSMGTFLDEEFISLHLQPTIVDKNLGNEITSSGRHPSRDKICKLGARWSSNSRKP